jgi:hypothetical protein
MNCSFCNNKFSSKSALHHHQKTAKYCVKIQGKNTKMFTCKGCKKILSTKQNLKVHMSNCIKQNESLYMKKYKDEKNNIVNQYKQKLKNSTDKIIFLQEELQKKDIKIQTLQDKLENIAIKAVQRPTTTNMNKTQINNIIQKMEPVTTTHLIDNAPNLTLEHVQKGASGYAEYALEYPLKDRVACVDYSRRKIKFKDNDGNVITDPEMAKLAPMFFESIKNKSSELVYALNNTDMDSAMFEQIAKLFNTNADVKNGSSGVKSEFFHDFVKHVCSGSVVD